MFVPSLKRLTPLWYDAGRKIFERSSVAEPTSATQPTDLCDATNRPATQPTGPLRDELAVRQAVLTNADVRTPGRALVLGSLDTPGSTRHLEIGVVLELVK